MPAILCALDFNGSSDTVLKVASTMAVKCEAHLTVLFSYRLMPQNNSKRVVELRNQLEAKAKEEFAKLEKGIIAKNRAASYEFRSEIGFLSDRIMDFVRNHPAELVVIGQPLVESMSEQKGLSFEQFLDDIQIPVLVVPDGVKDVDEFLNEAKAHSK